MVEDDVSFAQALHAALVGLGQPCEVVSSGAEAIELLDRGGDFGMALVDLHLPGDLDGFQLVARIRALAPRCRIVVSSGRERTREIDARFDVPPDGYLQKPFGLQALGQELRRHLGLASGLAQPSEDG